MRDGTPTIGWRHSAVVMVLAVVFAAGWSLRTNDGVRAEQRRGTTPNHFKSGGARSEAVLVEIASSLKRIETRLERMEELARGLTNNREPSRLPSTE